MSPARGGPERPARGGRDAAGERPAGSRKGLQKLGDLLPDAAREFGLEEELELAGAISAWQRLVAERIPAAAGSCRLVGFAQGVATVETDKPIVAQELRLRAPELVVGLRSALHAPVRQLRITARHV
jgi:predicted nucleic acid-binding Zn ribbon protein